MFYLTGQLPPRFMDADIKTCSLFIIIQMSDAKPNKSPKPFLKRGARQFLSNATVRSLNQIPKIVEFGETNQQDVPWTKSSASTKQQEEDLVISIKPKEKQKIPKQQVRTPSINVPPKSKPPAKVSSQQTAGKKQNSKKKSAQLQDYLAVAHPPVKKDPILSSLTKQRNKAVVQPIVTMANLLKRQDEQDNDESSDSEDGPQIVEKNTGVKAGSVALSINNNRRVQPKSVEQPVDIHFNSDSDEEEKPTQIKNRVVHKTVQPQPKRANSNEWNQDENESNNFDEEVRGPSKLLQKYYQKQVLTDNVAKVNTHNNNKKITIADIPIEVKAQLEAAFIAEKTAEMQKKFAQLESIISKKKKEQQKYQQQNRRLAKERQQFAKQMEQKEREFEEKVKSQSSKLTRQKRYMKDQQTTGKADWKIKNELEQLRTKLEQSENQKKKIKTELTRENDRLRKKLQEQIAEKESLKAQIRCIQMEKIQSRSKEQPKLSEQLLPKISHWADAPKKSYVLNFFDDNFTLISLDASCYHFQNLEYYKYYLTIKDEESQLVSEEKDNSGSKIVRKYKNGKQEEEYVSKVLKQSFPAPFKFTIVHHLNGDVKLILPEGIHIYYDSKRQITEFRVTPSKMIHHFHRDKQIEMKFTSRRHVIHETMKDDLLIRRVNQDEERFKRNDKGQVFKI